MDALQGKVALVTGAASKRGIGHAVALRLAQEGADVAVTDASLFGVRYTDDDRIEEWHGLQSVEAEIKALGRKGFTVEADICSWKNVEAMVANCKAEFGLIDILVNTAGIRGPDVPVLEVVPAEDWQKVLGVNVLGPYFCAKAIARTMIERGAGGKIINLSSITGKTASPAALYSISKFEVIGLTQSLALELAPYKINVNAICPGPIATEFIALGTTIRGHMREGMNQEEATVKSFSQTTLIQDTPLGRIAQPEEVAGLVAFLASNDSDYMTGQAINFTGGKLMCH